MGESRVSSDIRFRWYNTPNRHFLSIADFADYCRDHGIQVLRCIPLVEGYREEVHFLPNLRASEVIFVISGH